ncbi:MAG: serine/threonine protein kinase [Phycisphaerae bacterium]|nr:serine/threonine protein kinase [Phycisphaerae bacterium]
MAESEGNGPSYARVREVFLAVEDLSGPDLHREVGRLCGSDDRLRTKVLRMLDGAARASTFLLEPATLDGVPMLADPLPPPETIGAYRINELLGEGGFGSVYRARQEVPIRRDVAIKIIKPGMDTRSVIARFEAERQTLALLHHPNIAQVFEAGATPEGRPYFVMELIPGEPITRYCDHRRLTIEERLVIFCEVCRAIEHAHQKGVIHRDLKPSNILVQDESGHPVVKVIDFGIAKAIEPFAADATRLTVNAQIVGTPDYMSPEQLDGGGADTRVDIYALGVLLFELLTSFTPLGLASRERSSLSLLMRAIREEIPKRPSARLGQLEQSAAEIARLRSTEPRRLRARIEGDLDWIVLKAIEKERERRYDSVGALASDILHHLAQEPVSAARPGAWYTAGKFVRRHRLAVAAVSAVVAALAIGLTLTAAALTRAMRAESELRLAHDQAVAVNDFLVDDLLGAANTSRAGHTVTVVEAMKGGLPHVDQRFAAKPAVGARVKYAIGSVFRDIGLLEESVPPLKASVEALERELGPSHANTIDAKIALGDALRELGRDEEAEAMLRPAVAVMELTSGPDDPRTLRIKGSLGEVLQKRGRHDEADALLRETIERMVRVLEPSEESLLAARMSLVASLGAQARDSEALPYSQAVLDQAKASFSPTHPAVLAAMNNHAAMLSNLKRYADAEPIYRDLLSAVEGSLPAGHWQIAVTRFSLGHAIGEAGRAGDAIPLIERAIVEATAALGPEHDLVKRMTAERDGYRHRLEGATP